ncbi:hypothetical protein [Burkholderia glumae]|uniref:hypothetical protein n=1 Tax=Burkholderia glumae TaxID=337 RepID=UPI002151C03A|nr:hypothetical protein [Burkholderia glumae]
MKPFTLLQAVIAGRDAERFFDRERDRVRNEYIDAENAKRSVKSQQPTPDGALIVNTPRPNAAQRIAAKQQERNLKRLRSRK